MNNHRFHSSGFRRTAFVFAIVLSSETASAQSNDARLIAPPPSSTVTTRRPTLRTQLGANGTLTICRDRAMRRQCLHFAATQALSHDLAPGLWFWRGDNGAGAVTPVWPFVVARTATLAYAHHPSIDFDGDGFSDVALAAGRNRLHGATGDVEIFRGSPRGLAPRPVRTIRGVSPDDHFGSHLAAADVNGDGLTDLVIGAAEATIGARNSGVVQVHLGSARGVNAASSFVQHGDAENEGLGMVARLGDVNGDGFEDVGIGAISSSSSTPSRRGRVEVHLGSSAGITNTVQLTLIGDEHAQMFGIEMAAGDFDSDGYADVAIADPFASRGGQRNGSVAIYRGSASGLSATPVTVLVGQRDRDGFGGALATGDVNGDGFADLLVGAPTRSVRGNLAGGVYVYRGSATGLSSRAEEVLDDAEAGDSLGWDIACADLDGDGRDDAVVTAPNALPVATPGRAPHPGFALMYHAGPQGFGGATPMRFDGTENSDLFGRCIAALDIRGDGFADVLIGSALVLADGGEPFGYMHVFDSTATGTSSTATLRLRGAQSGDLLGSAIAH